MGYGPVTVQSSEATLILDVGDTDVSVAVFNNDADTILWLGTDDQVTAATGIPVPAQTWSPGMELRPGEALYGRAAEGTIDARHVGSGY